MRTVTRALLVTSALVLGALACRGDDAKVKPGASNLESALKRAGEKAKADAKARKTTLARITAAPSDAREFQAYVVICEFKDASLAVFQGGSEEAADQYVTIEKDQTAILGDAVARVPAK